MQIGLQQMIPPHGPRARSLSQRILLTPTLGILPPDAPLATPHPVIALLGSPQLVSPLLLNPLPAIALLEKPPLVSPPLNAPLATPHLVIALLGSPQLISPLLLNPLLAIALLEKPPLVSPPLSALLVAPLLVLLLVRVPLPKLATRAPSQPNREVARPSHAPRLPVARPICQPSCTQARPAPRQPSPGPAKQPQCSSHFAARTVTAQPADAAPSTPAPCPRQASSADAFSNTRCSPKAFDQMAPSVGPPVHQPIQGHRSNPDRALNHKEPLQPPPTQNSPTKSDQGSATPLLPTIAQFKTKTAIIN
jgi:hypothetical protein